MDINLDKMRQLIEHVNIAEERKSELLFACALIKEGELAELVDACMGDETIVLKLAENFEKKEKALSAGSMEKWRQIVDDEILEMNEKEKIENIRKSLAE